MPFTDFMNYYAYMLTLSKAKENTALFSFFLQTCHTLYQTIVLRTDISELLIMHYFSYLKNLAAEIVLQ